MSNAEIVRAWKDPEYRSTLSVVPTHPAGLIELADRDFGGTAVAKERGFRLEAARRNFYTKNTKCLFTHSGHCGFGWR